MGTKMREQDNMDISHTGSEYKSRYFYLNKIPVSIVPLLFIKPVCRVYEILYFFYFIELGRVAK